MTKKQKNKDALTLLFVLAIVILVGVAVAWTQKSPEKTNIVTTSSSTTREDDKANESRIIILITAIAAVGVVCIYTVRKVKTRKKREAIEQEKEEQRQRIEEAKERVARARMQEFLDVAQTELHNKRSAEGRSTIRHKFNYDDFEDEKSNDRVRRRKNYELDEFDDEYLVDIKRPNIFKRIIYKVKKKFRKKED